MASNYHILDSPEQLQSILSVDLTKLSVLYFRAEWAEVCKTQCDGKLRELATKYPTSIFLEIEAESLPDVSESFDVASVPYFVLLRGHSLLSRIEGAKLAQLEKAVAEHAAPAGKGGRGRYEVMSDTKERPEAPPLSYTPAPGAVTSTANGNSDVHMTNGDDDEEEEEESEEEVFARCRTIMNQSPVVLFMKGNPEVPRCGFSQKTVKILKDENIEYTSYDILSDEGVRQGLKKLNAWPTFPQLIVNGELVGGLDILQEMVQTGELKELLAG